MLRRALLSLAFMSSVPALAQTNASTFEQRVTACIAERDNAKRLACFDSAVRPPAPVAATPVSPPTYDVVRDFDGKLSVAGAWRVRRETDSLTDKARIILSNEGTVEHGRSSKPPVLVVRCFQSRLELFVVVGEFLGSRDSLRTMVRFGTAAAQPQGWSPSAQGTAVFSPSPATFLTQLSRTPHVLMEISDFRGVPTRLRFQSEGINEAVAELAPCWRPPQEHAPRPPTSTGRSAAQTTR